MTIAINGTGTVTGANTLTNTNTVTSAAATALTLQSAGTTAVTIDTSQNVGIGTSSPSYKLDVSTNVVAANFSSNTAFSGVLFKSSTTTGSGRFIAAEADAMTFGRYGVAEHIRIDSSGNFLIGVTSQFGFGKQCIDFSPTANTGIAFRQQADTNSPTPLYFLNAAGTAVGSVVTSSTTTTYNTSSDYRLKNNITPMTGALDKVALLKPVTYKWNADNSDGQGFIAHELAEVCPHAVTGEKDAVDADGKPQYQGIDVSFLVATLTAAIQELKAIIDTQATRITALENK